MNIKQITCWMLGHNWVAKLHPVWGLSRPYCLRCDTEKGAPKVRHESGPDLKRMGIRLIN